MKVYLIKKTTMGGSSLLTEAYINKDAAILICEDLSEEFISYEPVEVEGEEISGANKVIIERAIYDLLATRPGDVHRARGRAKLTIDEVKALGL